MSLMHGKYFCIDYSRNHSKHTTILTDVFPFVLEFEATFNIQLHEITTRFILKVIWLNYRKESEFRRIWCSSRRFHKETKSEIWNEHSGYDIIIAQTHEQYLTFHKFVISQKRTLKIMMNMWILWRDIIWMTDLKYSEIMILRKLQHLIFCYDKTIIIGSDN